MNPWFTIADEDEACDKLPTYSTCSLALLRRGLQKGCPLGKVHPGQYCSPLSISTTRWPPTTPGWAFPQGCRRPACRGPGAPYPPGGGAAQSPANARKRRWSDPGWWRWGKQHL